MAVMRDADTAPVGVWFFLPDEQTVAGMETNLGRSEEARAAIVAAVQQRITQGAQPIVAALAVRNAAPSYISTHAPIILGDFNKAAVDALAARNDVDAIYLQQAYEPEMPFASKSTRADVVWARGIEGNGARVAVVEVPEAGTRSRIDWGNEWIGGVNDATTAFQPANGTSNHATRVAGRIAGERIDGGRVDRHRGVAPGATLFSANATSSEGNIIAASDWALGRTVDVLNYSLGQGNSNVAPTGSTLLARYIDFIVRTQFVTVVKSAGNRRLQRCNEDPDTNPCPGAAYNNGQFGRTNNLGLCLNPFIVIGMAPNDFCYHAGCFVTNPALAYNHIVVGAYEDNDNYNWDQDAMWPGSCHQEPAGSGRQLPHVAAVGATIAGPQRGGGMGAPGNGTSFAAPGVSGVAALIIERVPALRTWPEAIKAIIMTGACHNIEGDSRLSDLDGAGGVVACESDEIARDGRYHRDLLNAGDFTGGAPGGNHDFNGMTLERSLRSRVALTWSVPATCTGDRSACTYDPTGPLTADLDLRVYDPNNVQVASSLSSQNNYEIVEFTPSITGVHRIEVRAFTWTVPAQIIPIGIAWTQEPCCSPDWGDAPDDMLHCLPRPKRGDFPTKEISNGANVREFEVEWLSQDDTVAPGATWELDGHVFPFDVEKDEDVISNIRPDLCLPDLDTQDDGVVPDSVYIANSRGRVTFYVDSATPNVGRYFDGADPRSACDDERLHVWGWFDWEHDDVSWGEPSNYRVHWRGGPGIDGVALVGTCIEGCDLWDQDAHQKKVTIEFDVPEFLPEGPFWIRFRLSYGEHRKKVCQDQVDWTDKTTYGEVEDHISIQKRPPPPDWHTTWVEVPTDTVVDFSTGVIPIPGGFFGSGSDPFTGQVPLRGAPGDPELGDSSVCLQRFRPFDLPADGSVDTVDTEITQLSLTSSQPITVTYNGGADPELWKLDVTLSPSSQQPPGSITSTRTHLNGGTFDADILIFPLLAFTRYSDGHVVELDMALGTEPTPLQFTASGHFVETVDPSLGILVDPANDWVSGVREIPLSTDPQQIVPIIFETIEVPPTVRHTVCPPRIPPPRDPHETVVDTFVELGSGGSYPAIPGDFFGPGSDPFVGRIDLTGVPLDPLRVGSASTEIQRRDQVRIPTGTLFPTPLDPIPVEIVQLELRSVAPIRVTYTPDVCGICLNDTDCALGQVCLDGCCGQVEFWDVDVDFSAVPQPQGTIYPTLTHANGGTFDLNLPVIPRFQFVKDDPNEQVQGKVLDAGLEGFAPIRLSAGLSPWVRNVNPALGVIAPNDGDFVPGVEETVPGDIESQQTVQTVADDLKAPARHTVVPPREVPTFCLAPAQEPNAGCGDSVRLTAGPGDSVELDILLKGWAPHLLASYQVTVDSSGYQGVLQPDPALAQIDQTRPDYVFSGAGSFATVDTTTPDYRYGAGVLDVNDSVADPGTPQYAGTLVLDVPLSAAPGTFNLCLFGFGGSCSGTNPLTALLQLQDGTSHPGPIGVVPLTLEVLPLGKCCYAIGTNAPQCIDGITEPMCNDQPPGRLFVPGENCTGAIDVDCPQCLVDADCDDGDPCTTDTCISNCPRDCGTCPTEFLCTCEFPLIFDPAAECCDGGELTPLDDGDDCTDDTCSEPDGRGTPEHTISEAGTACDDGGLCTYNDVCNGEDSAGNGGCAGTYVAEVACTDNADCLAATGVPYGCVAGGCTCLDQGIPPDIGEQTPATLTGCPNDFELATTGAGGERLSRFGCVAAPEPPAAAGGSAGAIRVRFLTLYNTAAGHPDGASVCADRALLTTPQPSLSQFEGQTRWFGAPVEIADEAVPAPPNYIGAPLTCTAAEAEVRDWSAAALAASFGNDADSSRIYFYGPAVVPCSVYEVSQCSDPLDELTCSDPVLILTSRMADAWPPFEAAGQPSFTDINTLVNKYKGIPFSPGNPPLGGAPEWHSLQKGNVVADYDVTVVNKKVGFLDIGVAVDGYKGIPYREPGPCDPDTAVDNCGNACNPAP
jgi:hypothetical protein